MLNPWLALGLIALATTGLHAQTLLLEYDFNIGGTSATTAVDTSGHGLNGTFLNSGSTATALQTATGVSGNAGDLAFDNTASTGMGEGFSGGKVYTTIGSAESFGTLDSFTVSMWLNPTANFTNIATVFNLRVGSTSIITLAARSVGDGRVNLTVEGVQGVTNSNTVPLSLNSWNYLAVTYDGSSGTNNVTFYLGSTTTSVTAATTVSVNAGTVDASGALTLSLGNAGANFTRPFDGLMDNVALYSGALNTTALEALRMEAIAVPEPAAVVTLLGGLGAIALASGRGIRRARRSNS